jgi:hypothetical protein
MEESIKETEEKPKAPPVPPWKIQNKERTMDIKPASNDEEVIKEKEKVEHPSKKKLRKVGVMSLAKAYGVMGLVMGLVIALVYGVIFFVGQSLSSEYSSFEDVGGGFIKTFGIIFILAIPFIYAIFGFISGAIAALGFNVVMRISGGIELDFEE